MPAIELRADEIGFYDPEAAKARRERMWGKPKVNLAIVRPPEPRAVAPAPAPAPVEEDLVAELFKPVPDRGAHIYAFPIGPEPFTRDWLRISSGRLAAGALGVRRRPLAREIIAIVARVYGIDVTDIKSHRRTANIVRPRQEAMWLCKKFTLLSLPEIGRQFGGRDHTTALHAVRKIEKLVRERDHEPLGLPFVQDLRAKLEARANAASAPIAAE